MRCGHGRAAVEGATASPRAGVGARRVAVEVALVHRERLDRPAVARREEEPGLLDRGGRDVGVLGERDEQGRRAGLVDAGDDGVAPIGSTGPIVGCPTAVSAPVGGTSGHAERSAEAGTRGGRSDRRAVRRPERPGSRLLRCAASQRCEPPSSSGPGRRPFKAVTGIRTPLGAPAPCRSVPVTAWSCGAVWSARRPVKAEAAGSNPVRTAGRAAVLVRHGRVAQSAEHTPEKRGVTGSTPVPATSDTREARSADRASRRSRSPSRAPQRRSGLFVLLDLLEEAADLRPRGTGGDRRACGSPRSCRPGPNA